MIIEQRTQKKKPKKWVTFLKKFLLILILGIITTITAVVVYIFVNLQSLPKVNKQSLNTYEPTKIVDSQNNVIWQSTTKHVGIMSNNELPSLYSKSLIAVEDGDFWTNKGYSKKGVANMVLSVLYSKINPNVDVRGGSTLEQQLIKNVYFDGGNNIKTTTRKIQEIYLAQQLDHNYSKKQILTYYVNNLSFAEGDEGIKSVMMTYFGKQPSDYQTRSIENIAEQAYLAGLGQNPTVYNLYTNPKAAAYRKNTVLKVMESKHYITKDEYTQAKNFDLTTVLKPRYWESTQQQAQNLKYKAYTDQVLTNIKSLGYNINDISMTVHTFLNQDTFNNITNTVRNDKYYQDGNSTTKSEQVGATVMDKNGIVQGMVGSRFANDEVNRATQHSRSSGSSLKPFTAYGPLFQYFGNKYNTATEMSSENYLYPGTKLYMHNWGNYTYGNVSLQKALRMSLNTVVGRIDDDILGSTRMKTFLHGVGLDTKSTYSAIDGIGLYISTVDAAAAYNTLNNGGVYIKPRFINYITFSDGSKKVIPVEKKRVMNESTAWVLTQMLRGVVSTGYTGASGAISAYTGYAAKTGTVGLDAASKAPSTYGDGGSDSWFDSITNNGYAIALWFGYDKPNTSPQVSDSFKGYLLLGKDLQLQLNGNKSIPNWTKPSNVKDLGGDGLDANYAITDSKDITTSTASTKLALSSNYTLLNGLNNSTPKTKASNKWKSSISSDNQAIYGLFNSNSKVLNSTDVINSDVYNALQKGGN